MLTCGKRCLMSREQLFVPLELEVGMQAALHQNLIAAELDRFLDLLVELVALEHVAFGRLRRAIERAEIADRRADVRVVDVAVDVVGAVVLGMQPARDLVGRPAERRRGRATPAAASPSSGVSRSPATALSNRSR